jgi:hypothetical protein
MGFYLTSLSKQVSLFICLSGWLVEPVVRCHGTQAARHGVAGCQAATHKEDEPHEAGENAHDPHAVGVVAGLLRGLGRSSSALHDATRQSVGRPGRRK